MSVDASIRQCCNSLQVKRRAGVSAWARHQGIHVPRILVADDNNNIQKMVALAFEERGISVTAVGNGEAAVRRLA